MDIKELKENNAVVRQIADYREVFWENCSVSQNYADNIVDIDEAEARLIRFAPFIKRVFPQVLDGIIESPLEEISRMKETLDVDVKGTLFLKCDSHLPISGSVKARGGIYEVLKLAEKIAMEN